MAKKQSSRDPSGVVFDVQSKAVLAQGGAPENMKEKIGAVRAIVPNRSNTEIVLVLQHFDNCVARTVQAFMEGNASEVLKEWTVPGRRKNKKKKGKAKAAAEASRGLKEPGKCSQGELQGVEGAQKEVGINGYHVNGCAHDTGSMESLSEGLDALSLDARELEDGEVPAVPARTAGPALESGSSDSDPTLLTLHPPQSPPCRRPRPQPRGAPRPLSRSAPALPPPPPDRAAPGPAARKLGANLERSVKDLQRCAASLARYRALLKEELEASLKRMKQAFAELQSSLMDREVTLLAEMDKVKAEAMEILGSRQRKAEGLRQLTEAAGSMAEEQLLELRADIKHFVSERKLDEELCRVAKFSCDLEGLKSSIAAFGQVSQPRGSYSSHRHCSPPAPPSLPPAPAPASASSSSSSSSRKPSASLEASSQREDSRRPAAAPRGQPQRPPGSRHRAGPGPSRPQPLPPATPTPETPPPATPPPETPPQLSPPQPKALPQRRPRAGWQEGASC